MHAHMGDKSMPLDAKINFYNILFKVVVVI